MQTLFNTILLLFVNLDCCRKETSDPIEREGIDRALINARAADLVILVMEADAVAAENAKVLAQKMLEKFGLAECEKMILTLVNKTDLLKTAVTGCDADVRFISCKTNSGVHAALERLREVVGELCTTAMGESPLLTRQRHRQAFKMAIGFWVIFTLGCATGLDLVWVGY
jgi:tRNA U34 5-carboxymethylaminomethyl modifying GTPase MnmE/TrmE